MDFSREISIYKSELYDNVLPFWKKYAPDEEYGGFFTCFSNTSDKLLSEDKYLWSQGRMLFILSRLLMREDLSTKRREDLKRYADKTADFLMKYSRLESGNCTFLTDRRGNKKPSANENGKDIYDSSIYADCFVIIGLSEYARYKMDFSALSFATDLYLHARERYNSGKYRTDPYPTPNGYRVHGVPMIFTNTSDTLYDALDAFEMAGKETPLSCRDVRKDAYSFAKTVVDNFIDENGILREMVPVSGGFDNEFLLGRYINPGHTVEDAWFMKRVFDREGDTLRLEKTKKAFKTALTLGFDKEYCGIRLFADMTGGEAHGKITDPDEPMVKKVLSDQYSKLWWVHSEALYSTLLFGEYEWYEKIRDYTLNTFRNTENDRGEWIQIRNRVGEPENRIVALPVKDPFHIMRNLIFIIELLESGVQ